MIFLITESDAKGGNRELRNWNAPIPQGYHKHLADTLNKYQQSGLDRDCEGYKRLCNLVSNPSISYLDMKRIKNYFDNCTPADRNTIPYFLNGGDLFREWVNNTLNNATQSVKDFKETKKKMGVNNAYHKAHNQQNNIVKK